jgi:hypothetical protein
VLGHCALMGTGNPDTKARREDLHMTNHMTTLALAVGLAASAAGTAGGQIEWNSLTGGQWSTQGNWDPAGVPMLNDPVTVSLPGIYAIQIQASSAAAGTLTITNPSVSVAIHDNLFLQLNGDFVNDANLVVNFNSSTSTSSIRFLSSASSLTGGGTIVLNAASSTADAILVSSPTTNILNHGPGHTITGTGQIRNIIHNNGLISAAGGTILLGFTDKTNNNVMMATQGGVLEINGITITQTPSGVLRGNGGNILAIGCTVVGGTIEGFGGGVFTGSGTIDGVTVLGDAEVPAALTLNIANTLTNNGTIVVNPTGGTSFASINMLPSSDTIDGNGQIVLNAVGLLTRAQINPQGASGSLTNGANHTISGNGQLNIDVVNNGTISPGHTTITGDETQIIDLPNNRTLTCQPSSALHMQIAGTGPGEYDTITGGTFTAGGTLRIENIDGFGGLGAGEFLDIIIADSTVTGTFANVQLIGGAAYNVVYMADRVRLEMGSVCLPDVNGDGAVTPTDFTAWINAFNNNLPECDQNGDGSCTPTDFTAWIANFNAGC